MLHRFLQNLPKFSSSAGFDPQHPKNFLGNIWRNSDLGIYEAEVREWEKLILTWVVGLAIDELVEAPTSKSHYDEIHDQVEKQQWSCYVPSHCLSHIFLFHVQSIKTPKLCLSLFLQVLYNNDDSAFEFEWSSGKSREVRWWWGSIYKSQPAEVKVNGVEY